MTERKEAEEELQRIEWLLTNKIESDRKTAYSPQYGNLVELNTSRVLAETIGEKILTDVVDDYLDLLESSAAVYEANGDYALAYITELDPTWQNDAWGAIYSPETTIFANKLAQASCALDAVAASAQHPLDAMFWCAGSWGGIYPLTGNANASVGRIQSAELEGAKLIARLSRIGMLWDSVGPWAMCSPVPMPIWIKSEFSIDPVYPIISRGNGMAIGAAPISWLYSPVQSYPAYENINQVIFQEQQCCLHV